MKKIQRAFYWAMVASTITFNAQANGGYYGNNVPTPYQIRQYPNLGPINRVDSRQHVNSTQAVDSNQYEVIKDQIEDNKKEIIILKTDIREIDADIRDADRRAEGCDCRSSCELDNFTKLGIDPKSSNSCRLLWDADRSLNSLSPNCRRAVGICKSVERRQARYETEERMREIQEENRELEREYRRTRLESRKVRVTRTNDECIECQERYRPSTWEGIIGTVGALTPSALGLMGMSMYNKSIDSYYGAYTGALNAYNTNVGSMYDHYTTLGLPAPMVGQFPAPAFFGQQSMGLSGWLGSPYGMMNGGFNPYFNGGFNNGFNGGFNNGFYNGYSPFGLNAQVGVGVGSPFFNGGFNPYMMTNGFSPFGINSMMNPYGIGAAAAQWPYQMGVNAAMSPFMGFNNGMMNGGYNPMLFNGGFNSGMPFNGGGFNGGFNNGFNSPWGGGGFNQWGMMSAQNDLQAMNYRYNQIMQQSSGSAWGAGAYNTGYPYNFGSGFGAQLGIGLNFGLSGGLNFGSGW